MAHNARKWKGIGVIFPLSLAPWGMTITAYAKEMS